MNTLICTTVFLPILSAVLCYAIGRFSKVARDYFADIITGVTLGIAVYIFIYVLNGGSDGILISIPYICGLGLHFTLDGFRSFYGMIAAFMWFMSTLFSKEYFSHYRNRNRYYLFLLVTLGSTMGVFWSADFYTTFIFFEIMSFTSYVWVAHDEKKDSLRAASTYLAVAVIGGLVMLMGIFLLYDVTNTLYFSDLTGLFSTTQKTTQVWIAGICLLFGFGAKAGAFPLHIWLPKAHPVAPAPASALLSGILTKAGMYGVLILTSYIFLGAQTWGSLILILGVFTMVIGAVLALFSIDLKRTLACSSVSQIGFILVGVGMSGLLGEENVLAVRGSMLHMVNHSLIKLALFMAAGVVYMNLHKLDLNAIRGFGRKRPLLNYIFLMGALGIGGMPLWNGYVSKTLIHESIVEGVELLHEGHAMGIFTPVSLKAIEWIFLISGGMTVAYMTKLYVCIFVEKNEDAKAQEKFDSQRGQYMNKISAFALTLSASLLPILGFVPNVFMGYLADMGQGFMHAHAMEEQISYFSLTNLRGACISILIGALLYFVLIRPVLMEKTENGRRYVNRWHPYLDLENVIYRPLLLSILPFAFGLVCRILDSLVDTFVVMLRKTLYKDSKLPYELPEGNALTHGLAIIALWFQKLANKTIHRNRQKEVDYEHAFALRYEELNEDIIVITRSMSFGLLLFCIGLAITVVYLFINNVF